MKTLTADVACMAAPKDHAFTPPPRAWIADRIERLNELLAARTEKSGTHRSAFEWPTGRRFRSDCDSR